eukprot:6454735-Amphidinium_carterae.4
MTKTGSASELPNKGLTGMGVQHLVQQCVTAIPVRGGRLSSSLLSSVWAKSGAHRELGTLATLVTERLHDEHLD